MSRTTRLHNRKVKALLIVFAVIVIGLPVSARIWLHVSARNRIYSEIANVPQCRVALVLGARVRSNGKLSLLLQDRVDKAIELYQAGKVDKLLMSGDNRFDHYNEPKRMQEYAIACGVPEEDIAMDFAGRRTYDSVYRAKHIFGVDKLTVVTQSFHLDRALYYCSHLGVKACGMKADERPVRLRTLIREIPGSLGAMMEVRFWEPRPIMGEREKI
jgi:SanA protein